MPQFTDTHGIAITYYRWPVVEPRAIVQIAHGIGEHALRYEHLARALNQAGFAVVADDHRGHGQTGLDQTGGDLSRLGRLGPGGLRAAEDAIVRLGEIAREGFPGVPIVLLGHSWGSLMAQRIVNREPGRYDALVLTGSAYRMPGSMESGNLNRAFDGPGSNGVEWLSRDEETQRAFLADPLTFDAEVLRLFGVADGLRLFGVPAKGLPADLPILIASGAEDPLSVGDSVTKLAAAYRGRGLRDVTLLEYPGARHEIFNETNREQVIADLTDWLDARFPLA
ncbi:alpha/beta hydrolase [Leucobacter sp. M11]|uniref:alpha/beta hydrolase n=1 Tax=Leucobacter sp. M11 TaxID=2993565 RepID=UPI002D8000D8|nr:alpha/beta hydrolase [Leucobacter sp. M11]MEB4615099.1 alpha/beta hydrolase [Leucobacter sp. M11]